MENRISSKESLRLQRLNELDLNNIQVCDSLNSMYNKKKMERRGRRIFPASLCKNKLVTKVTVCTQSLAVFDSQRSGKCAAWTGVMG